MLTPVRRRIDIPSTFMMDRPDEAQNVLFADSPPTAGLGNRRRAGVSAPKPGDFGLTASSQVVKNYVLDTNVLLHDPVALERFKKNHLCIPVDVLAELDKFKSEQSERGANSRRGTVVYQRCFHAGKKSPAG